MMDSTCGLATETLGGGGGVLAVFSSHAVSATVIIIQARTSKQRRRKSAHTPGQDRFTRSNRTVGFARSLFTQAHQSGGGIDILLAFRDDGNPGAPGRRRTEEGPPGPQSVRSAITSRVA